MDERYHAAFSQNPQLELHEFIAKNVGIRRAAGSYILTTSTDTYLSGDIVNLIARRMLRPMTVYRATRVDLQLHLDRTNVNESALSDPRNWATVNVLKPPFLTDASGDFLLLDRFSFCALRGFNEVFRVARIHVDANFCYHAAAHGMALVDTRMRRLSLWGRQVRSTTECLPIAPGRCALGRRSVQADSCTRTRRAGVLATPRKSVAERIM